MSQDILNPHLGISSVLPALRQEHLPEVDDFNTVVGNVSSLATVANFKAALSRDSFEKGIANSFIPVVGADELLQPAKLNANLQSVFTKLSAMHDDADIRRFVREDLTPLMENKELLQAYTNLMVGG